MALFHHLQDHSQMLREALEVIVLGDHHKLCFLGFRALEGDHVTAGRLGFLILTWMPLRLLKLNAGLGVLSLESGTGNDIA